MTIGEIVKQYRDEHHLSQRQFAEKCGDITNGYISMIERGKNPSTGKPIVPSIDMLGYLARGMGMSLHELVEKMDDSPVYIGDSGKYEYTMVSDKPIHVPQTSEARILAAGVDRLPKAERERALEFARLLFVQYADYFERTDDDANDTES